MRAAVVRAVRGAIGVAANDRSAIEAAGARIASAILETNDLEPRDLVSLLYSVTRDLTSGNPATGARRRVPGLEDVPLFCVQEAEIDGARPLTIRLLATFEVPERWARQLRDRPTPVYLGGAEELRPDIAEEQGRP